MNFAFWSVEADRWRKKNTWAAQTWKYGVLVFHAAFVTIGVYEQMNKLRWNNIQGKLSIWSNEGQNCVSHHVWAKIWHTAKFTYQLRLVVTCLSAWTFVTVSCWLTALYGESTSQCSLIAELERNVHSVCCYQALAIYFPRSDRVWELLLYLKHLVLSSSSFCAKGKIQRSSVISHL